VVLLNGPLGAGKTVFVRGIARGMGLSARVRSPTFVFMNVYEGQVTLLHVDLYRIDAGQGEELGLEDLAGPGEGAAVTVVEWAERARERFPHDALRVEFTPGAGDEERVLRVSAGGERSAALVAALESETGRADRRAFDATRAERQAIERAEGGASRCAKDRRA
jgi:tRNA threonylcarbamoyladenosine biosynthesis protein TsaE